MTFSEFQNVVRFPNQISDRQYLDIADICKEYPYFSTAHLLYLKGLYKYDSDNFYDQLNRVAIYAMNRESLFELIFPKENKPKDNKKTKITIIDPVSEVKPDQEEEHEKLVNLEKRSFTQWLQTTRVRKTEPKENVDLDHKEKTDRLIGKFIEEHPHISSIKPKSDGKAIDLAYKGSIDHKNLMTETLARIYLDQKKYEKAEKAYRILSLKYPEKSGFFADKIKEIKKHKES